MLVTFPVMAMSSENQKSEYEENSSKSKELVIALSQELQATFPDLTMKLNLEPEDGDFELEIPQQEKLKFDVSVNLDGYLLSLYVGKVFCCEAFPCDKKERVDKFKDSVVGLLKGNYRILETSRGDFKRRELQHPINETWQTLASVHLGGGWLPFPPWWLPEKTQLLQNTSDR